MKTLASTAQSALLIAISTFFIGQFLASLPAEICLLPMLGSHICVKLPLNVPVETLNNTTPNIWTGAQLPQSNPTRPGSLPASILKKQPTYLRLDTPQEAVQVFGLVKLGIATDGIASNPFDPAQIDIQVHFISSHGTQQTATAFWYQDFDPVTLKPRGEPGWQVRFTPDSSGVWIVQAEIADPSLKSLPVEVKVNSSLETRGFVRTNKENPHYLAFDDGSLYFPIGMNIAWATSLNETLTDYQHWFDKLSANGGNFARVWMSSWDLGIEWNDTGLGDYTNRLKQAWLLDQVFEMAGQRGIYIMLTLLNHGSFSRTVDPEWSDNPYNARLGGPLSKPQDFVTDPQSIDLFKRRLSYIVARYGYSPNLMAWEWWNEVDRTPIRSDTLEPWLDEMDSYLKTIDPYQHLTTNSYSTGVSSLWSIPGLNIVQQHDYSDSDPMTSFGSIYNQLSRSGPGKPVMLGEYGSLTNSTDPLIDADPVHMHNGLWAAAFTGFAGTGMYWWWDKLVDPLDLWGQFKGISVFLKGEALPLLKPGKALVLPWKARALTMQNTNRLLAWIRSDAYTINNAQKAYTQAIQSGKDSGSWDYEPAQLSGLTITVTGLANGNYTAAWFDPETAEWMPEIEVTVNGAITVLPLPRFSCDLALKLEKRE